MTEDPKQLHPLSPGRHYIDPPTYIARQTSLERELKAKPISPLFPVSQEYHQKLPQQVQEKVHARQL